MKDESVIAKQAYRPRKEKADICPFLPSIDHLKHMQG